MAAPWDLLVADSLTRPLPSPTPRRAPVRRAAGKASAVIGMRRSGKTWLVLGELAGRVAAARDPRAARELDLYVSLEDERLMDVDAKELGGLLDAWFRRVPRAATSDVHLSLDEVQNVRGWERFVRRVLDRGRVSVTVTGSSARLLSKEIATSLRGRSVATEVLPFSFDELLRHRGVALPRAWPAPEPERALLAHALDAFLETGGFPEVVDASGLERARILRDYVDVVLFRDVVERHAATNVPALRRIVRRLASTPAATLSVHKLHNDLRSQGVAVGKDALYAYLDHVEDAYLAFRIPIRTDSERVRAVNPVKTYVVDTGVARAFATRAEPGHLLENAVYLELRRRGGDVTWLKTASGFEVDFVVDGAEAAPPVALVQVCADTSAPEVRAREVRALDEAMDALGVRTATLVTLGAAEDELRTRAGRVRVVPAWQWLLEAVPQA